MFGDKYKKDMERVSPSAEILADTAEKMNAAQRPKKAVYRRWVSLAAACLLLTVGIASIFPASRFFSRESNGENAITDGILGETYGSCVPEDELNADAPAPDAETTPGSAADYTTLCAVISDKLNEYKEIPKDDEGKDEIKESDETRDEAQDSFSPSEEVTDIWISAELATKEYDYTLSYNDTLVLICSEAGTTVAEVYSISEKEKLSSFTQSGEYISGKIENGRLYLVTLDSSMRDLLGTYNNSNETIINNLPCSGTDTNETVSADRIFISDTDLTFTVASCFDLETYDYASIAVMGGGSIAYIKDGILYVDKNGETKAYAVNGQ